MKRALTNLRNSFLAACAVVASVEVAFAAGGHHGHATIESLKWPAINFTVYVAIMFLLLRKVVANGWRSRSERIQEESTKGERELSAAQALVTAARERMTKLPAEKAELSRNLNVEAEAEVRKLSSDAVQKISDIERHTAARIAAEQQATSQRTRARIAARVLQETEQVLRTGISVEADKRLRSEAARSLQAVKHA